MERSRGGLTTKIHALVDANGNPIALKLTEGQAHDGRSAGDMLDGLGAAQVLLADRAYDSDALRASLAERGIWANIKPMPRRVNIPAFSPFLYRYRNLGERFFNKIKHFTAHRHPLREARRQLPRPRQTRCCTDMDALYESVT